MKRILQLVVLSLLVSLSASAQTITFMGIPVDGTPATFAQKLIAKGAKRAKTNSNKYFYMNYAGFSSCLVIVSSIHNKVSDVTVRVCQSNKWNDLYIDYWDLKNRLTRKYGEPVFEFEDLLYSGISDYEKYDALQNGESIGCKFNKENGYVRLCIGYFEYDYKGYVTISYINPKNKALADDDL